MQVKTTLESECQTRLTFEQLVQHIKKLDVLLSREEIERLLARVFCEPNDYQKYVLFAEPYRRESVVKSEFGVAELLVMTWHTNQQSPIHDHYQSSCGIRVLQGKMTETMYQPIAGDQVSPQPTKEWLTGEITSSEAALDIHKISNRNEAVLVTLHIYSAPLDPTKMRRFVEIK